MKKFKTDCGCATTKKPRIAGLCERPGGVSAVGSLSCTKIERAILRGVRQIAGANSAPNGAQQRLVFEVGSLLPYLSRKAAQIASQVETRWSVSSSARGAGFPQKRCGRRSPALPVTSQTRCLLSPKRRAIFLSALKIERSNHPVRALGCACDNCELNFIPE